MSPSHGKDIPSIPVFCTFATHHGYRPLGVLPTDSLQASTVASNSDVPVVSVVEPIYNAACYDPEDLLIEFERAYLLGRSQQNTFTRALEYAISCHRVGAIENLFKIDVGRVRQLTQKEVDVNAIAPSVISRAIQGERTDVDILRLFLNLGLDVRKVFGGEGDALMWAVRIGRWELIERILEQRGSFDVDEVKVCQTHSFNDSLSCGICLPRQHCSITNTTTHTPSSLSLQTESV